MSTAAERDREKHPTCDKLYSLAINCPGGIVHKTVDEPGASGKGMPATGICHVGLETAKWQGGQTVLVRSWPARPTSYERLRWLWLGHLSAQCTVANHFWIGSASFCLSVSCNLRLSFFRLAVTPNTSFFKVKAVVCKDDNRAALVNSGKMRGKIR